MEYKFIIYLLTVFQELASVPDDERNWTSARPSWVEGFGRFPLRRSGEDRIYCVVYTRRLFSDAFHSALLDGYLFACSAVNVFVQ